MPPPDDLAPVLGFPLLAGEEFAKFHCTDASVLDTENTVVAHVKLSLDDQVLFNSYHAGPNLRRSFGFHGGNANGLGAIITISRNNIRGYKLSNNGRHK
jgi:hypothetical protein